MATANGNGRGTLLVVGGSGFLGTHVVARGLDAGWDVVSASRSAAVLSRVSWLEGASRRLETDLSEPGSGVELVEDVEPRAVITCAALARIAPCEADPELARRLNVDLPRELAEACAARGARLVHVSTDLVFGGHRAPPRGFAESDVVAPVSMYGRTKAEGERAVATAHPHALIVRLPLLYGESFDRGLGATDSVRHAVAHGERPSLFADEWRTPLDVGDAAQALVEAAGGELEGLLHVGGPARLSRLELGLLALRGAGHADPVSLVHAVLRSEVGAAHRPEDVSLDSARASGLLATRLRPPAEALAR